MSNKKSQLDQIARQVAQCHKCPLYKTATNPVPGQGNPQAEIMFIGEGPGYYEDQRGIPFCGASGKLLDQMLKKIGIKRQDVFIGNVIKHRAPNNRDPLTREIEACREYLDAQIKIIKPKIIVTLGRFSMAKFIPDAKISRIHGQPRWTKTDLIPKGKVLVMPMYHPAAALRNGRIKNEFEQDFIKLPQILNSLNHPAKSSPINPPPSEETSNHQLSLI